jgi:hypothetical protein
LHILFVYVINDYMRKPNSTFRGPSLVLLAIVHILIFVANLVAAAALRHGAPYVNPFASGDVIQAFFLQQPAATRMGNFLLFGSAIPLGLFAVTAVSRLRYLGVRATGTNIALFGGLTAAIAVIFSGLFGWVLSLPDVLDSISTVKAVYYMSFLTGGVTYAAAFGLFAAGISITGYFSRHLPLWLAVVGMVVAFAGELSWFSLVAFPANFFIPITRYLGFLWMLLVAVQLTRNHRDLADRSPAEAC